MKHNAASATSLTNVEDQNKQPSFDTTWQPDFSKNKKEVTNIPIEETVIRIVGNDEIGYRAVLANIYISPPHKTAEEITNKVKNKDWNIIMSVINALIIINEEYNHSKMEQHAEELIK